MYSCTLIRLYYCSVLYMKGSILPDMWKVACIVPIYKGKGSKDDAINYRPIKLTSVICKLMKSIIIQNITQHCLKNNFI